jgi:predicted patatin/cPLA2 family phospholipase
MGALSYFIERGLTLPKTVVGTSAGAAIAAACLTIGSRAALDACQSLYAENKRMFHWKPLLNGKIVFAHQWIYPAWIRSFVNENTFPAIRDSSTSLWVAVTRPSTALGLRLSVCVGTIAYIVDKNVWHSVHPRLPRMLGLQQEFLRLDDCQAASDAQRILCASAAPPPIMPAVDYAGAYAFDGGYTDNTPIPSQTLAEQAATLVMLTRHYRKRGSFFEIGQRHYEGGPGFVKNPPHLAIGV